MSLATCPNCGKQSMGFRYRRFMRSRLGCVVIRCRQCGYKKGDAQPTRRIRYVVSQKVHTVPKDRAQKLVKAGNAVYV